MTPRWTNTIAMADRGQIVVVNFSVAGIVQSDIYNSKMTNTIVAMVTTNLARVHEPTHLLIDVATPEGKQSGLLHTSVVNCNTLATIQQHEVLQVLGSLPPQVMQQVEICLKAALAIP